MSKYHERQLSNAEMAVEFVKHFSDILDPSKEVVIDHLSFDSFCIQHDFYDTQAEISGERNLARDHINRGAKHDDYLLLSDYPPFEISTKTFGVELSVACLPMAVELHLQRIPRLMKSRAENNAAQFRRLMKHARASFTNNELESRLLEDAMDFFEQNQEMLELQLKHLLARVERRKRATPLLRKALLAEIERDLNAIEDQSEDAPEAPPKQE